MRKFRDNFFSKPVPIHRCSCKRGRGLNEPEMITKIITELAASYLNVCVCLVTQSSPTLCDPMDCSLPCSSVYGDSTSKNTGMGCHALCQGIFPTQGSNPGLLHCRWILYCLSHYGSPRILEWVAYPFSRESSRPRN